MFLSGSVTLDSALTDDEADKICAEVWVSTDGKTFHNMTEISDWAEWGKTVQRNCLLPDRAPLRDYLDGRINTLYVYLIVHFQKDASTRTTETATFTRPTEDNSGLSSMVEDGITVEGCYTNTVYLLDRTLSPPLYGQMHITAEWQEDPAEYVSHLPTEVPIQLDFYQTVDGKKRFQMTKETPYSVEWGSGPEVLADGSLRYQAVSLSASDATFPFELGEKRYQLEQYPDVLAAYPTLYCTVHPIQRGSSSQLLLSDDDRNTGTVLATLPLKPTDAKAMVLYTSTDGGETWDMTGYIDPAKYPIDVVPNQESYTVEVFSTDVATALMEAGNGGFLVRLQILGGPLGNATHGGTVTQEAAWPADYTYVPPKNPADGSGGEGNLGNAGVDNSGSTDGVRPGTEDDSNDSDGDSDNRDEDDTFVPPAAGEITDDAHGSATGTNGEDVNAEQPEQPTAPENQLLQLDTPTLPEQPQSEQVPSSQPKPEQPSHAGVTSPPPMGLDASASGHSDTHTAADTQADTTAEEVFAPVQSNTPDIQTAAESADQPQTTLTERPRNNAPVIIGLSAAAVCVLAAVGIKSGFLAKLLKRIFKHLSA